MQELGISMRSYYKFSRHKLQKDSSVLAPHCFSSYGMNDIMYDIKATIYYEAELMLSL